MPRVARVAGERRNAMSTAKLDLRAHLHRCISRVAAPRTSAMHSVTPVEGALVSRAPPARPSIAIEIVYSQGWPRRPTDPLVALLSNHWLYFCLPARKLLSSTPTGCTAFYRTSQVFRLTTGLEASTRKGALEHQVLQRPMVAQYIPLR